MIQYKTNITNCFSCTLQSLRMECFSYITIEHSDFFLCFNEQRRKLPRFVSNVGIFAISLFFTKIYEFFVFLFFNSAHLFDNLFWSIKKITLLKVHFMLNLNPMKFSDIIYRSKEINESILFISAIHSARLICTNTTFTCSKCCRMGSNEEKSLLFFSKARWDTELSRYLL